MQENDNKNKSGVSSPLDIEGEVQRLVKLELRKIIYPHAPPAKRHKAKQAGPVVIDLSEEDLNHRASQV
jgi:hypothetical protein